MDLGLRPDGRYGFGNDFVFVTDVGQDGDNVLLDDDRHLRFIDPIIGFKHPLLAMLSKSLETDAEVDALTRHVLGVNNM
jgi:hypothetical protein